MTKEELLKIKLPQEPYHIEEYSEEDEYGFYMTGVFARGSVSVIVTHNERWRLAMKSRTPLGLHLINEIRGIFIPNNVKMAFVLPPREFRNKSNNFVTLLEWPE